MCSALGDVCFVPVTDIREMFYAKKKTASRRSLRHPNRYFDQTFFSASECPLCANVCEINIKKIPPRFLLCPAGDDVICSFFMVHS